MKKPPFAYRSRSPVFEAKTYLIKELKSFGLAPIIITGSKGANTRKPKSWIMKSLKENNDRRELTKRHVEYQLKKSSIAGGQMKPKSAMTTIEFKKPSHECEGKLLKDAIDFVCKICGYHRREYDDGRVKTINFGDRRAKHYGNLLWR